MNSSGSAMKNVAQCSCGRSAVKVNWPWRLSMSTHPGGGQRGWLQPPLRRLGSPLSAPATPSLSARLPERHPISPRGISSDRPFAMGIWASSSLPGVRPASTPHGRQPGSPHSRRARRYSGSPSSSRFGLAPPARCGKGSWSTASRSWPGKLVSPEQFREGKRGSEAGYPPCPRHREASEQINVSRGIRRRWEGLDLFHQIGVSPRGQRERGKK